MNQKKDRDIVILAILIVFSLGFALSLIISPKNKKEVLLEEKIKQKQIEIDGVYVEIKKLKLELEGRVDMHKQYDSLAEVSTRNEKKQKAQLAKIRAQQRELLKKLTPTEKSNLIIQRYEKTIDHPTAADSIVYDL